MISTLGWRLTYQIISYVGFAASVLAILIVWDPPRGRFDTKAVVQEDANVVKAPEKSTLSKFKDSAVELWVNPTCRYCTIGCFFRFFGGYAIGFYMQTYFNNVYPTYIDQYAVGNAFAVSACGLFSSISGGYIADVYEKKNVLMSKAYICLASAVLGSITFSLVTLV